VIKIPQHISSLPKKKLGQPARHHQEGGWIMELEARKWEKQRTERESLDGEQLLKSSDQPAEA
jgi:hypothetical protein